MSTSQFELPDVGEGLTEAEIVSWRVAPGDAVAINQVLVEIETAKSLVELPSPFAGVVEELLVEEGQTVDVGTPIISVSAEGAVPSAPTPSVVAETAAGISEEGGGAVLVGYGLKGGVTSSPQPAGGGEGGSSEGSGATRVGSPGVGSGGIRLGDHREAPDSQAGERSRRSTSPR